MRKTFMALIAAGSLATVGATGMLIAQTPAGLPGAKDATRITAGTYAAEGGHSQVLFAYDHFGFTQNMGLLSGATGTLTLDPKAPEKAAVSVDVPISTIRTTIPKLDEEFLTAGWFDAAKFPTARFVSTSVKVNGTTANISGNLTIKGITKPVVLEAEFTAAGTNPMNKKNTVAFNATTTIKRSEFGLGNYVPMVSDAVELKIVASFEKQ